MHTLVKSGLILGGYLGGIAFDYVYVIIRYVYYILKFKQTIIIDMP